MTIREFKKDKFLFYPFLASVILALIAFIRALVRLAKINNLLILHFDSYRGIDYLGNKEDVFSIIGFSFTVIVINFLLAKKLYYKERLLSYFLSFGSTIFSLLILIGVFVIISIN
jgi:hypothetical protein